ncbi:MAG TPA: rhomboid family intramembrane serine protease [Xanthobacteraceae bacterium]|nr:rhomboid family intramembrane serine protease [Xanthobacteraceae bacterium]
MSQWEPTQASADTDAPAPDTFCAYLAKQLIAKQGFDIGTVSEAAELAAHCDVILSRHDGYTLTIACLVDREANPGKTFDLSPDAVEAVGQACLKYSGQAYRAKMPLGIEIYEVGPVSPDDSQRQRLALYKRSGLFSKVIPSAAIVDTTFGSVWPKRVARRRFIEKLLRSPRESDAALRASMAVAVAEPSFPWLTYTMLAALIAIFAAELIYGIGPWTKLLQPSTSTLVAFGGLMPSLVFKSGEWYRPLSAPLLHADAVHLLMNGIALFLAGRILESLVGRAWFATMFVISAICGSLLSLTLNADNLVSVGASGAVTGLFAAMLVTSFHFPSGADRTSLQMAAIYVLVPALLPLLSTFHGIKVDYGAHFGGALGGLAVGLLMLALWPRSEPRPRCRPAAAGVAMVGLVAFAYPALPLARNYPAAAFAAVLFPQALLPKSDVDARAQSADLVARYPRDPRARLFRAAALLETNDKMGAERELRAGLAEEQLWRSMFNPDLSIRLHTMLATLLADTQRPDEARAIAQPVCAATTSGAMRALLDRAKLCGT